VRSTVPVGGGRSPLALAVSVPPPQKKKNMKPKHIAAIVAALAVIAAVTVVAAEKRDGKSEDGIYRLKSHGQVVAEIRVVQ
jgi:hypothetical protein